MICLFSAHLLDLDVVPLLRSLQRLQVVAGGVVVDQLSPPFGDLLLREGHKADGRLLASVSLRCCLCQFWSEPSR